MKILADESVDYPVVEALRAQSFDVKYIAECGAGLSDNDVLRYAETESRILLTADKDFGELLFSHGIEKIAVLFIRYDQPQYNQIENYLLKCIEDYLNNPEVSFITITKNKIRTRKI